MENLHSSSHPSLDRVCMIWELLPATRCVSCWETGLWSNGAWLSAVRTAALHPKQACQSANAALIFQGVFVLLVLLGWVSSNWSCVHEQASCCSPFFKKEREDQCSQGWVEHGLEGLYIVLLQCVSLGAFECMLMCLCRYMWDSGVLALWSLMSVFKNIPWTWSFSVGANSASGVTSLRVRCAFVCSVTVKPSDCWRINSEGLWGLDETNTLLLTGSYVLKCLWFQEVNDSVSGLFPLVPAVLLLCPAVSQFSLAMKAPSFKVILHLLHPRKKEFRYPNTI